VPELLVEAAWTLRLTQVMVSPIIISSGSGFTYQPQDRVVAFNGNTISWGFHEKGVWPVSATF
jgi:hypothetical protein